MFITILLILVASSTTPFDNSEGFIAYQIQLTLQGLNLLSSSNPLLAPSIVTELLML